MSNALSFFLLLVFALAAGWLVRLWQGAENKSRGLVQEIEALETERKALARRVEQESQARRKQSEDLAELRRRSEKAKRRAEKVPDVPLGTAARIRDVELELERSQAALRRAESERDEQARRADGLRADCAALEKRVEAGSAPAEAALEQERALLERVRADLAVAIEQGLKRGEELALARQTELRMRKRMENQEQLYASLRAELEIKKDRLRTQEEHIQRLEALKAAVLE